MSELNAGSVTIADLYRELVGMRSDLTRVLAKQEATDVRNLRADQIHADVEARLLVKQCLSPDAGARPLVGAVAAHPFLWRPRQRLQYLEDVGNKLDRLRPAVDALFGGAPPQGGGGVHKGAMRPYAGN